MNADADPHYCHRLHVRRLKTQFGWRQMEEDAWAEAAHQINPAPIDDTAARNACLTVYSQVLFDACQDKKRQEQAYTELHNYLWPQAYARDPELAADAAQGALLRIFEAFHSPDPNHRPQSGVTFLRFTQYKLWHALRDERRQRILIPGSISLDDPVIGEDGEISTLGEIIPDPKPSPEGQLTQAEEAAAAAARLRWMRSAAPRLTIMVVETLVQLWRKSLQRQLTTVILTYIDGASDDAIAARLQTTAKNVQPLRSRGLDKVHDHLQARLAFEQGGYA